MTILRPITNVSPSNREVLHESGIPFSFVLTPFARRSAVAQGDDDKFFQKRNKARDVSLSNKIQRSSDRYPTKASLIAKCTHCGSPLNPTCRFIDRRRVLCNICGRTYDADFESQMKIRPEVQVGASHRGKVHKSVNSHDKETRPSREEEEYNRRYGRNGYQEEFELPLVEFSLPVMSIYNPETHKQEDIYTLPAQFCPPLLAVFIDGTSNDPGYYERIAELLKHMLDDSSGDYKGTRMGIFIMTSNGGLSIYDFTNPGGHLKHLLIDQCPLKFNPNFVDSNEISMSSSDDDYNVANLEDIMTAEQIFAPLDGIGKLKVDNAIREIADWTITIHQACQRGSFEHGNTDGGVYLGRTLQYFLEFMGRVAYQPSDMQRISATEESFLPDDIHEKFVYAGGKMFIFLSQAPQEIGNFKVSGLNGRVGMGGFGGSCAEAGKRFSTYCYEEPIAEEENVTVEDIESGQNSTNKNKQTGVLQNIKDRQRKNLPETKYLQVDEYYQDIGTASAMGAFGIEIFALLRVDECSLESCEPYFGIPLLRLLSDRSGGCGPLLSTYPQWPTGNDEDNQQNDVILNEVIARSPWKRITAFGAMLRIRSSRCLGMDTLQETSSETGSNRLVEFYNSNGMYGGVTASVHDDELYIMGSCDTSHTLTFDLKISSRSGSVEDYIVLEGVHEIYLKPCIQTQSLDTEALAVSMFHKFQQYSLAHGPHMVQEYATSWALNVLLCCYKSAQKLQKKISQYGNGLARGNFFAADRLLGIQGSTISAKEVLLAQGHEELQSFPLLVFSLIQCDALRPNDGEYNPSLDARAAAAANMSNMTPDVIARCIAPRLEVWTIEKDTLKVISDGVSMNMKDVQNTAYNHMEGSNQKDNFVQVLFVDTPSNIILCDCQSLLHQKGRGIVEDLSAVLDSPKAESLNSYRVPPPLYSSFKREYNPANAGSFERLKDAMIEDSRTSLNHQSFHDWCTTISEILQSETSKL